MLRLPLTAGSSASRGHVGLLVAALLAVTGATYANVLGAGFVWDDHVIVLQNPDLRDLSRVGNIIASPDVLARSQPAPYYRPLHRLSYLADFHLFGLDPRLSHLLNVALHAAAVLALFGLGSFLFGDAVPAFLAALLFAVHPVNSEAVDFVTARNNLLVGLFVLSAALSFLKAQRERRPGLAWVAGTFFLLGLFSKETGFMVFPFLLLWESLPCRTRKNASILSRAVALAPMVLATVVYAAFRARVLSGVVGQSVRTSDLATAMRDDLHILPEYLRLLIWPTGLTVHHGEPGAYFSGPLALVGVWVVIVAVATLLLRQRRPVTWFGLLWFAVNFAPVSGIIPIPSSAIAERFMYVPAIGLWLVAADQIEALREKVSRPDWVLAGAVAASTLLALVTVGRNRDWRSDTDLFESALRVAPMSTDARYNLAIARLDAGDAEGARREWERTVAIDPRHAGALAQLGTWYAQRHDLVTAENYFERVLAMNPRDVETRFNLAVLQERLGRNDEALRNYREFLRLDPVDYPTLVPMVQERIRNLESGERR
jgi:protein O-mannosyl-transferase